MGNVGPPTAQIVMNVEKNLIPTYQLQMMKGETPGKENQDVFTAELTSVNNIPFMMDFVDRRMEWLVRVARS